MTTEDTEGFRTRFPVFMWVSVVNKWVCSKLLFAPDLFETRPVENVEPKSEAFAHFRFPLFKEWAGGRND